MPNPATADYRRTPLTRERVLQGAVVLADAHGIAALTIRALAQELGVKPMAVYHHVAGKDEILDGIVDIVFSEIDLPVADGDWRGQMSRRADSARRVLRRHPWAVGLLESRSTPGPATLRHHDATLAALRIAGFTIELAAHAYALLDSYVYGFAVQEAAVPPDAGGEVTEAIMRRFAAGEYPYLVEMATEYVLRPGYDFGHQFRFGLEIILDGLERVSAGHP